MEIIVPEKTIEAVVNHQLNTMLEKMPFCKSVELSGFGKFLFNSRKALKAMQKCEELRQRYETELQGGVTAHRKMVLDERIKYVVNMMEDIKPRLHED